jgi:hypothetical protein
MMRSDGKVFGVSDDIKHHGNWNLKFPDSVPVKTKPMAVIYFGDGFNYVFSHDDVLKLVQAYIDVDEEAIRMILDSTVDTGLVNSPEISFKDKLLELLSKNSNSISNKSANVKFDVPIKKVVDDMFVDVSEEDLYE